MKRWRKYANEIRQKLNYSLAGIIIWHEKQGMEIANGGKVVFYASKFISWVCRCEKIRKIVTKLIRV